MVWTAASRLRFSAPALVLMVVISLTAPRASFSSASLCGVEEGSCLLHLTLQGVGPTIGEAGPLGHLLPQSGGFLVGYLGLPQLGLVPLDALQSFVVSLIGVVEGNPP